MRIETWVYAGFVAGLCVVGAGASGCATSADLSGDPNPPPNVSVGNRSGSSADGSASDSGTTSSSGFGASSGAGDDSGAPASSGPGDDGGSSSSSGASASGGGGTCSIAPRGPAPTTASASKAGPYQTMSYAANARVRMTNAYDVTNAHIYYPVGATAPFASLAIVPGFVYPESSIGDWGTFLASWGFVVLTIGTSNPSTGASDMSVLPPVRGAALLDALTTLKEESTRSGGPLEGQLDLSRQGVAGWSMGGGGTLIDANTTPSLKAVFAMQPWNTNTSYATDTVPTLIFAGTNDGLAGPPMPQNQYMSIPATTPKILYEVQGGSHYVSTSPMNSTADMAPDSQSTANVARFGLSWLKVFLECDDRFRPFLLVKPDDAAEFDSTFM